MLLSSKRYVMKTNNVVRLASLAILSLGFASGADSARADQGIERGVRSGNAVEPGLVSTDHFNIGDRVWMWVNTGGGQRERRYGDVFNTAPGTTYVKFDDGQFDGWIYNDILYHA
jgi:hypothetical protein